MTSLYNYLFGSNKPDDVEIKNEPLLTSLKDTFAVGLGAKTSLGARPCPARATTEVSSRLIGVLAFNNLNYINSSPDIVKQYINPMIIQGEKDIAESGNYELLTDVFLLAIYKRAISTKTQYLGEGRRMVYYDMILELYKHYPLTTMELIKETPSFGCWVDLYKIWELVCQRVSSCNADAILYTPLIEGIIAIIYNQLVVEFDKTNKEQDKHYSLLIKWFAREKSHYDRNCFYPLIPIHGKHQRTSFSIFAILIRVGYVTGNKAPVTPAMLNNVTGNSNCKIHIYTQSECTVQRLSEVHCILRHYISDINKEMCTTETLMCSGQWEHIIPTTVPVKCMKKNKLAMLNELSYEPVTMETFLTGNRYPDNIDRVTARKNLIIELKNGYIESKNLYAPNAIFTNETSGSTVAPKLVSYDIYRKELDKWANMKSILFTTQEKYFTDYIILDVVPVPSHSLAQ